ncbi:lysylphosphatidylglycerol synthase transmembrane domain-containing protein [Streptomyces sp. CB01881]|uniref:lysylphosphatidylglycerol synthase transmembrane domain-containing protein n=1 Tax=Streptomyces sp. CB01881 TaxID=2078691 RepID=UPI0013869C40|nr:lysylphosphatidylglycerol synthase transmembrane domain-containing protein [Streptomyces sp. CB01881]
MRGNRDEGLTMWPGRRTGPGEPSHATRARRLSDLVRLLLRMLGRGVVLLRSTVGGPAVAAGRTIVLGTRRVLGGPGPQTAVGRMLEALGSAGFRPNGIRHVTDAPDGTRWYHVPQEGGPPLDVRVIDRAQLASGSLPRLLRWLRFRPGVVERGPRTPRQVVERAAVVAAAVAGSGVPAPQLLATVESGTGMVLLVYEQVEGRTLDQLADAEIDDELQARFWRSVALLHDRRIAHRGLAGSSLLINHQGVVVLAGFGGTALAADDLVLGLDIAQLLTVLALRVGPERAVAAAAGALGEERVAAAVPLLQPAGLSRTLRADLRLFNGGRRGELLAGLGLTSGGPAGQAGAVGADGAAGEGRAAGNLLAAIRGRVLELVPGAPASPARLSRVRLRTVLTVAVGGCAVYYLLTGFPLARIDVTATDTRWLAYALLAALLSHPVAAMGLSGFVPERLPFGRVLLAQLAGSFVKLVAPVQLAGVTLAVRFLQKSGVRPVLAVASVGLSQLALGTCRMLLLLVFGAMSGIAVPGHLVSARAVAIGLPTVAIPVLLVAVVSPVRRRAVALVRRPLSGVAPRLLDLLRQPDRLVTGLAGHLLLTVTYVLCLAASLRAFGGSGGIPTVAVAFLTAHAVGSVVPTPGGIGAVETALIGTLTGLAQVPAEIATPSVLLYRVLVFWLPALPGWICFGYLQRKGAL